MKKKLLFVIDSLSIGGAEKSLVSLLNLIEPSKYEIDLLLFKRGEDLERYLPKHINILPVPEYFRFLNHEKFAAAKNITYSYYKIKTSLNLRLNKYAKKTLHSEQVVYKNLARIIYPIESMYDVAIAYSQGMPTYFVASKVKASKKLAWINTDYVNTLYDKELDYESYKNITKIIAVSQHTKESVMKIRTDYDDKIDIVFDIVNPNLINTMSEEVEIKEFDKTVINILTVGRLVSAKSYESAIGVARLLKDSGYRFKWFVIGEGPERKKLQELIVENDLLDSFFLLGKRLNPYPYMKNCDIYVQTSIKEGFGLTVCEAKILKRPIVCSNFHTAKEIINNNIDGLIVEHNKNSIFNGIKKYLDDSNFREEIVKQLNIEEPYNSINQLNKFYQLIEN